MKKKIVILIKFANLKITLIELNFLIVNYLFSGLVEGLMEAKHAVVAIVLMVQLLGIAIGLNREL